MFLAEAIGNLAASFSSWLSADTVSNAVIAGPLSLLAIGTRPPRKKPGDVAPVLVQEGTGFYLSISKNIESAGRHAAELLEERYHAWLEGGWQKGETEYKTHHFTIAVGGGNTIKAEFRDLLRHHVSDIDWIEHVRFFFLEASSGEPQWESSRDSLVDCFIAPLAALLIGRFGRRKIAGRLELAPSADEKAITRKLIETMLYPFDLSDVAMALEAGDAARAAKLAGAEAERYEMGVAERLGPVMAFHLIITGIAKDGGVGAFAPYTPELREKAPGVSVLDQENGAVRIALNRGVLTNAECVTLVISGSLKLKALGRFEIDEIVDFETTVMETPLRMFRETRAIAEKVYVFADNRALRFDQEVFAFKKDGKQIKTKAEVRKGGEEEGIHILLLHGFMGLYSYINLLIRLPSAWTVSALHRGSHAKRLSEEDVFPHYALALRKAVLRNARNGLPTPLGFHSIAGVISDQLLVSAVNGHDGPLPEFDELKKEDQKLIEALRIGGLIHMASWAPSDTCHVAQNGRRLRSHWLSKARLDYRGPRRVYDLDEQGKLQLNELHDAMEEAQPPFLGIMMKLPTTEYFINAASAALRFFSRKTNLEQRLSNREIPYAMRIVGSRMLLRVSYYGLLKEIDAALHDSHGYQERHLRALDIILKYDIPYLSIVHKDDFMISAIRHREEHNYLLARRMEKEGVAREEDLKVPVRLLVLERSGKRMPVDPLNPHLMIMCTSMEGDRLSRRVTAAVTRFVNENVAAAVARGATKPLGSVARWMKAHSAD